MTEQIHGIPMPIDTSAFVNNFMKSVTPVRVVIEAVQNAIDSVLPPWDASIYSSIDWNYVNSLHNEIDIFIPSKIVKNGLVLAVADKGLSLVKDYDFDIFKFINAPKGTSTKKRNPFASGYKGIAMSAYLMLANRVRLVTADRTKKNMLYGMFMYWGLQNGERVPFYSEQPEYDPITPSNIEKYRIRNWSTVVAFHDPTDETLAIPNLAMEIRNELMRVFGLIMSRRPNLRISINGQKIGLPEYLNGHPERLLVPEMNITGNIYPDPNGLGVIKLMGRGGLGIMEHHLVPSRRCTGYAVDEKLEPNMDRTSIVDSKRLKDALNAIDSGCKNFKLIDRPKHIGSDKQIMKWFEKEIPKDFADLAPKVLSHGSQKRDKRMDDDTGNLHQDENDETTTGHGTRQEPDPEREIIKRPNQKPRDLTNQQQVGVDGIDEVLRTKETEDKRNETVNIVIDKNDFGQYAPLYEMITENKHKWIYRINTANPLYLEKVTTAPNARERKHRTADQTAMARIRILQDVGELPENMNFEDYRSHLETQTLRVLNGE